MEEQIGRNSIVFVPSVPESEWVTNLFPTMSPAELPIAGRRIIDYGIEHALKFGHSATHVIDWHYVDSLAEEFAAPTRGGYTVSYRRGEGEIPLGLKDLERLSGECEVPIPDGTVVVWGICLSGHSMDNATFTPISEDEESYTPMGVYYRLGGGWVRVRPRGVAVHNIKMWHRVNFAVLHRPGIFTLPGYSAEEGIHIGRNVVMEHGTRAKGPVLLCDDTWCARNVQLDGDVILGRGAVISEGARLKRTVVGDDTMIGIGLELVDKIVIGRRIIDADTGVWTDIEEPGIARHIGSSLGFLKPVWNFLLGASRGRHY